MLTGGALRWSRLVLTASTTVGLGGAEPRSLDGGRMLRCERREDEEDELSGTMLVPLA
jgi:hypothetical protein